MQEIEIGIVDIDYSSKGEVKNASFRPTLKVKADATLKKQLLNLQSSSDSAVIKSNAELMFASWFSKINEIELADRDEYEIHSDMVTCLRYKSGMVKKCVMKFSFRRKVN